MRPLTLALLLAVPALAPADPLGDAVRDAVAAHKLRDSDLKGSGAALTPYRDLANDGGILVGLEIGLGGTAPSERVAAVRPVYRTAGKTRPGTPAGHFLSDEVTRTVRLMARDGYAIGGLRITAGRRIDGLAVRFYRIGESGLDPHDAYESDWVGARSEGRDSLDGQGRPAVGLLGRTEGDTLLGLGLTFADLPVAQPPSTPTTTGVGTITPETAAEESHSSGNTVLAMVVFAAVALPVGLIGVWAVRPRPAGVQQLPRAVKSVAEINLGLTRPPSIPTDLLLPPASRSGSRPGLPKPDVDQMVALETESFRN